MNTQVVEHFLERLLPFCGRYLERGRYLELRSVIFIDNTPFYFFFLRIKEMFAKVDVLI